MKTLKDCKRYLDSVFYYESDGVIDTWEIIDYTDINSGDCDDYALTLAYIYSDENLLKMYWNILTFKIVFWLVEYKGNKHIITWVRGEGWTDNIMKNVSTNSPTYKYLTPLPIVYVGFKHLMGSIKKVFYG